MSTGSPEKERKKRKKAVSGHRTPERSEIGQFISSIPLPLEMERISQGRKAANFWADTGENAERREVICDVPE